MVVASIPEDVNLKATSKIKKYLDLATQFVLLIFTSLMECTRHSCFSHSFAYRWLKVFLVTSLDHNFIAEKQGCKISL